MDQLDLSKLAKLIKSCRESGVSILKLGSGIEVYFSNNNQEVEAEKVEIQALPEISDPVFSPEQLQAIRDEQEAFDDEMLHITDPAAWQRSLLDSDAKASTTGGGDEEMEFDHVQ